MLSHPTGVLEKGKKKKRDPTQPCRCPKEWKEGSKGRETISRTAIGCPKRKKEGKKNKEIETTVGCPKKGRIEGARKGRERQDSRISCRVFLKKEGVRGR
jgi:hypothetical protein